MGAWEDWDLLLGLNKFGCGNGGGHGGGQAGVDMLAWAGRVVGNLSWRVLH